MDRDKARPRLSRGPETVPWRNHAQAGTARRRDGFAVRFLDRKWHLSADYSGSPVCPLAMDSDMTFKLAARAAFVLASLGPTANAQAVTYDSQTRMIGARLGYECCEETRTGGVYCHGCTSSFENAAPDFGPWVGSNRLLSGPGSTSVGATQTSSMLDDRIHAEGTCDVTGTPMAAIASSDFAVSFTLATASRYRIDARVDCPRCQPVFARSTITFTGPAGVVDSLDSASGPRTLSRSDILPAGSYTLEAHANLRAVSQGALGYSLDIWVGALAWSDVKRFYATPSDSVGLAPRSRPDGPGSSR